jgi:hypothetical protein
VWWPLIFANVPARLFEIGYFFFGTEYEFTRRPKQQEKDVVKSRLQSIVRLHNMFHKTGSYILYYSISVQ